MSELDKPVVVLDLEKIAAEGKYSIFSNFEDNLECNRESLLILTGNAKPWVYIKILDLFRGKFDAIGIFDSDTKSILVVDSKVPEFSKFDIITYIDNNPTVSREGDETKIPTPDGTAEVQ